MRRSLPLGGREVVKSDRTSRDCDPGLTSGTLLRTRTVTLRLHTTPVSTPDSRFPRWGVYDGRRRRRRTEGPPSSSGYPHGTPKENHRQGRSQAHGPPGTGPESGPGLPDTVDGLVRGGQYPPHGPEHGSGPDDGPGSRLRLLQVETHVATLEKTAPPPFRVVHTDTGDAYRDPHLSGHSRPFPGVGDVVASVSGRRPDPTSSSVLPRTRRPGRTHPTTVSSENFRLTRYRPPSPPPAPDSTPDGRGLHGTCLSANYL